MPVCTIDAQGMQAVRRFPSFGELADLGGPGPSLGLLYEFGNAYIEANASWARMGQVSQVHVGRGRSAVRGATRRSSVVDDMVVARPRTAEIIVQVASARSIDPRLLRSTSTAETMPTTSSTAWTPTAKQRNASRGVGLFSDAECYRPYCHKPIVLASIGSDFRATASRSRAAAAPARRRRGGERARRAG